ncbi:MAG: DUF4301 family protein [Desulfuromonadales bacterium]
MNFSTEDLRQLKRLGIDPAHANRQITLLRTGQIDIKLERPCIVGDGINQLQPAATTRLQKAFVKAAAAGRLRRFVPASGAASRMFSQLQAARNSAPGGPIAADLLAFLDNLDKFAFYADLQKAMAEDGQELARAVADHDLPLIIRYLLDPCGLGYALLPKGLLAFHNAADGARTPFIEHLAEAALLSGLDSDVDLHFTVSPEHLPLFRAQLSAWLKTLEETYGCHFRVTYSEQKPSTDTLALDDSGQPLRDADGQLFLRPGGHGALIENLNDLNADILLIRNIDNVVPDVRKQTNLHWTRLLTGHLLEIQEEQHALLKALQNQPDDPMVRELAISFLADRLQTDVSLSSDNEALIKTLDRPIRVCGMVPNSGEPGGGPFWVRNEQGRMTRQIVEASQIDKSDPEQAAILSQSTHFNPVDMVCAVRNWQGRPYDLTRFVNDNAVLVTTKHQGEREIRVLELPGLWNGGMAAWHTLFVEIPPEAFNPVKTVFDLLRPAHQG